MPTISTNGTCSQYYPAMLGYLILSKLKPPLVKKFFILKPIYFSS